MFKLNKILLLSIYIFFVFIQYPASAEEEFSPVKNNGKKWRIGYYEGDSYYEFVDNLRSLIISLHYAVKLIENPVKDEEFSVPEIDVSDSMSSRKLWSWLSKNVKSDYIEFVDDAFWSGGKEEASCDNNEKSIYKKTVIDKDIDIMIAMGTVAGKCLSKKDWYNTNTIVITASNPVLSGIIKRSQNDNNEKYKYSGVDHIYAVIEKNKFYDEISLFYKIARFKKLGIVYRNTENEKIYAAVEDAKRVANENNFELIEEYVPDSCIEDQCMSILVKKYIELAKEKKVDAIYITEHLAETEKNVIFLKKLIEPVFKYKIATWSQTPRTWMVKYGVLMSLAGAEPADIGGFAARVMAQILNGKKPGEIDQIFVNPKKEAITLNLAAAQKIQLDLSLEVIASADKVYEDICKKNQYKQCIDNEQ